MVGCFRGPRLAAGCLERDPVGADISSMQAITRPRLRRCKRPFRRIRRAPRRITGSGAATTKCATTTTPSTKAEKSVSLDPKNSLYHQWLGRPYGGKADRDRSFSLAKKVKNEFQEAVSLNPSNIAARRDLEEYCLDAPWIAGGSKDEALQQVNAIAAIDPVAGPSGARRLRSRRAEEAGRRRKRDPPGSDRQAENRRSRISKSRIFSRRRTSRRTWRRRFRRRRR